MIIENIFLNSEEWIQPLHWYIQRCFHFEYAMSYVLIIGALFYFHIGIVESVSITICFGFYSVLHRFKWTF